MKTPIVWFIAAVLMSATPSCEQNKLAPSGPPGPPGPPLAANQVLASDATIRFVDIEGGCWALITSAGKYEPIDLPDEFRKDGLAVYVVARGAPDMGSICQMAPLVRLDTIRAR
jgi:hypothetical protein